MFLKKNKTFIIAEIGNNHEGSLKIAKELIRKAKLCEVDAVKLQFIDPSKFFHSSLKKNIKKYKKFFLGKDKLMKLKIFADKLGIKLFTTFFDLKNLNTIGKNFNLYKIASSDNNYKELISETIKKKKKTFISLGLLEKQEILRLINFLKKINKDAHKHVSLMYCVSSYPADKKEIDLNKIIYLKQKFPKFKIGYSDHFIGNEACLAAVSLGAEVIEKHFTLSKKFSKFRDHQLSADPKEMKSLVKGIRIIDTMLFNNDKNFKDQKKNIKTFRRSIFLSKDLKKGKKITKDDLIFLRPQIGLKLEDVNSIIGKKIKNNLKKNTPIKKTFFK